MEFEKLKSIIMDVLNQDTQEITMESTFVDDLGADSLDIFQISWELKKPLISKLIMMKRRRSLQ